MNPSSNFHSGISTQQQLLTIRNTPNNDSQGASASFSRHQVSIAGLDKSLVLKCLWDGAHGEGEAFANVPEVPKLMRLRLREMDINVAEQHIQKAQRESLSLDFDYLDYKPMKIDISGNDINTESYDYHNGDGSARRAIEKVRALATDQKPLTDSGGSLLCDRNLRKECLKEFQRFDQATANVSDVEDLTDDQRSKLLEFVLYNKGDGVI